MIKVYGDGDLRVSVGGQSWTFNPACLTAYQRDEEANLMTTDNAKESKSEIVRTEMSDFSGIVKWLLCCNNSSTLWTVLNSSCLFFLGQSFKTKQRLTGEAKPASAAKCITWDLNANSSIALGSVLACVLICRNFFFHPAAFPVGIYQFLNGLLPGPSVEVLSNQQLFCPVHFKVESGTHDVSRDFCTCAHKIRS